MQTKRLLFACTILISVFTIQVESQLKRLGQHSAPSKGAMVLGGKFPPPGVFFHHFTKPGKPLLMKNVLEETSFPAFEKWTDDYIRDNYGNEYVAVEGGKKEDRDGDSYTMPLARFVNLYENTDIYMVHTLPESMHVDIKVPNSLTCGGYQDNLVSVVMWYSSGNTSSVLHYDSLDNINCVLDGKKHLVLIDKAHKDQVEEVGWEEDRGFSWMDVDAVDAEEYPGIANTPWVQINLDKGDCVFIPNRWYHHVYTPPGRSLAINFWFAGLHWYNETNCDGKKRDNVPLTRFKMASSNAELRSEYLGQFEDMKFVKEKDFLLKSWCRNKNDANKLWERFNTNKDTKVTWEELSSVNFDDLIKEFPDCFHLEKEDTESEEDLPPESDDFQTKINILANEFEGVKETVEEIIETGDINKENERETDQDDLEAAEDRESELLDSINKVKETETLEDNSLKTDIPDDEADLNEEGDSDRDLDNVVKDIDVNIKPESGEGKKRSKTKNTKPSGHDEF